MESHRHDGCHGVDVKKGQQGDGDVLVFVTGHLEVVQPWSPNLAHIGDKVVVGQAHALGRTSSARRVRQACDFVVGIA